MDETVATLCTGKLCLFLSLDKRRNTHKTNYECQFTVAIKIILIYLRYSFLDLWDNCIPSINTCTNET